MEPRLDQGQLHRRHPDIWRAATSGNTANLVDIQAGTIVVLHILFDEGTTRGGLPLGPGFVYLDNIAMNDKVFTGPMDNGKPCEQQGEPLPREGSPCMLVRRVPLYVKGRAGGGLDLGDPDQSEVHEQQLDRTGVRLGWRTPRRGFPCQGSTSTTSPTGADVR